MRKYCGIFRIALANQLEYRVNFISSFLFSLAPFGVNTLLWIAAARGNDGMPLGTPDADYVAVCRAGFEDFGFDPHILDCAARK